MQIDGGSGGGGLQSEINVTPLVDVVLVLLIIFMVIIPLTIRGYDVDIPRASFDVAPPEPRNEQVVLAIDAATCPIVDPPGAAGLPADCVVRLNDDRVGIAELAARVGEIFAQREAEHRVLFLAAQDRLNYEGVMRVIDVAKSGVDGLRIGLVTGG
ncbi:MAG TPA: biopolymer transporter ExbD [Candidatus Polarisedimenticolaceae bacterium]|nr:biopolymer transporter ExbD [Candidatus Polarisedimenticolaceae bacterium]